MAVAGDILEQPEAGWTRYELLSYPIDEYPQIDTFEETGIRIQTPGNSEDKIKIGSRIRIFGKITNPITAGNQATSSMTTKIGTAPPTTIMQCPVMPLTDNKYTLIAEIELTDVYFPQDSTYIYFWGNTEYGDRQAVISAIDIFEGVNPAPTSSLPIGTYTAPQTIELSCATEGSEIRYLAYSNGEEPAIETVDMSYGYNLYTEPFEIGEVVIYAQAWKDGVAVSEVISFVYNILEETEEEEEMKEILLGLLFLKLRVVGTTEWIELGDSKTEAKFKYEEKYADVKTVESGNVDKVLESTTTSIEVGISQVSKELIDKLSNTIALKTEGTAPNEKTYLEGGAGIGTVAPKFEVIAHPIEEGTTTEYDIYLPKATIETSIDKTGKAGDQLVFNLKIEALFDRTEKCKFRIGKNPA